MICFILLVIFYFGNYLPIKNERKKIFIVSGIIILGMVEFFGVLKQEDLSNNALYFTMLCFVLASTLLQQGKGEYFTTGRLLAPMSLLLFLGLNETNYISQSFALTVSLFVFVCTIPSKIKVKAAVLVIPIFCLLGFRVFLTNLVGPLETSLGQVAYSNLFLINMSNGFESMFYFYCILASGLYFIKSENCIFALNLFVLLNIYFFNSTISVNILYTTFGVLSLFVFLTREHRTVDSLIPLILLLIFQFQSMLAFAAIAWLLIRTSSHLVLEQWHKVRKMIDLSLLLLVLNVFAYIYFQEVNVRIYIATITFACLSLSSISTNNLRKVKG